jgi:hypothetical protein
MNLQFPFYKFPFRFDVERLLAEVDAIPESAWRFHHENFKGNSALHLITTNGGINDEFEPPMRPTEVLGQCPYIRQVLAQFRTLLGRARLMRLEPGHGVPAHFDMQHYWRTHTRVHIPLRTHPDIRFHSGDVSVHMAAGEAWTFDNWRVHKVVNETEVRRIHLTFDTYGSTAFWTMAKPLGREEPPRFVAYDEAARPELAFETFVDNPVMAPGDVELELSRFASDAAAYPGNDKAAMAKLMNTLSWLRNEWRVLWCGVGPTPEGVPQFVALMRQAFDATSSLPEGLRMASNGRPVMQALPSILAALVKPSAYEEPATHTVLRAARIRFDRPLFVVAAPRSGSTWLYEMLSRNRELWTLGDEGHGHVERIEALDPRRNGFGSNRLAIADATDQAAAQLRENYLSGLRDAEGRGLESLRPPPESVRFLEKTPKNAIRIPFLKRVFPDAKFVFLHREPAANISAIMEAWRSGRFVTYPELPGWPGPPWSMLLIPGWRELAGADLARIAMRQWRDTNAIVMEDLSALPHDDWHVARYEDLQHDAEAVLSGICAFAGLPFDRSMRDACANSAQFSRYTLTPPDPAKWRKNGADVERVLPETLSVSQRLARISTAR